MRTKVIVSLLLAGLVMTADIMSRPYLAFGGGSLLFTAAVVYWGYQWLIGEEENR